MHVGTMMHNQDPRVICMQRAGNRTSVVRRRKGDEELAMNIEELAIVHATNTPACG